MSEWITKPLGKTVTFQKGRKVETSAEELPGYLRYLGAGSLVGKNDGYASTVNAVRATSKDVLMLWDGERSGLVGYNLEGVVSSTVSKLATLGEVTAPYLYYFLSRNFEWIQNRRTGTGVPHVPKDLGRIMSVDFPKCEASQNKITSILQTVDDAIEQTEALIEKYSLVKAGMMHDLFTRGLTPDGKLRPPHEEAPDLYKETPIGRLPKEWDCSDLHDLLAPLPNNLRSGPFGSALLKSELVEEGIPFLGIDNIHVERFVPVYRRFVSDRKYRELIKYSVRPNDLVITIMGTVGRCAVVPETVETALSSKHLWTISLDQSAVIPALVCWQMNYAFWVKKWFRRETQGGIMDAIQSKTLKTLKLPVPPMPEQILIADRYTALSYQLRFEQERLGKLQLQKSGLMHDLLTGEVPVKLDDAEAAHV